MFNPIYNTSADHLDCTSHGNENQLIISVYHCTTARKRSVNTLTSREPAFDRENVKKTGKEPNGCCSKFE